MTPLLTWMEQNLSRELPLPVIARRAPDPKVHDPKTEIQGPQLRFFVASPTKSPRCVPVS